MLKKLLGTGNYAYVFRFAALMVFIAAVVVMLESFMRNICEHIRGLVPAISRAGGIAKLLIDIGVVVLTGCCIFLVAEFVEFNREHMIADNWGLCAAALAAPLFCTLTYRHVCRNNSRNTHICYVEISPVCERRQPGGILGYQR